MRACVLVLVIACGGSSPKPASAPSPAAPSPAPVEPQPTATTTPDLPQESKADAHPQVAKGGDPCEGGEATGEAQGMGGVGARGTGPGGGGVGEGTIGTGTIGTIGHGSGTGAGFGRGGKAHVEGPTPTVKLGPPIVKGALDQEIVRRILRRHIPEVQYCYEVQLQTAPTLAGTLTMMFTITGAGIVGDATANGVDDKIATCVAKRIKAWEFPKPKQGTVDVIDKVELSTR